MNYQMGQKVAAAVAAAVAAGEVQVETRAPSSGRQVWHHGAAALLGRSSPFFNTSKARIYGALLGFGRRGRGVWRVARRRRVRCWTEGGGERRRRRGARERGKQRGGGGGEVRSYVAVHHA